MCNGLSRSVGFAPCCRDDQRLGASSIRLRRRRRCTVVRVPSKTLRLGGFCPNRLKLRALGRSPSVAPRANNAGRVNAGNCRWQRGRAGPRSQNRASHAWRGELLGCAEQAGTGKSPLVDQCEPFLCRNTAPVSKCWFQVAGAKPLATGSMVMQSATGQTIWQRLQPTHSDSSTTGTRILRSVAG